MRCLALLVLAAFLTVAVSDVSACINDRESIKSEKEFKSRYNDPQLVTPEYKPSEGKDLMLLGMGGTGVAFLAAALVLGIRKSKRR